MTANTRILSSIVLVSMFIGWIPAFSQERQLTRPAADQSSQKRLALVIGNGAYVNASPLENPVNDANDVAAALESVGFEVMKGTDQGLVGMRRLIREFGDKLDRQKGVGLFYYAGHGVEVRGKNFLIPVDADIKREVETEDYAIDVDSILRQMDAAANGFNIVVLDACRNNPFSRGWNRSGDSGGLANVLAPTGTYIAYSAAPGTTASDGAGTRNSPFAAALVKNLKRPNLKLEDVFKATREAVMSETGNRQVPWDSSSIKGDFYFFRTEPTTAVTEKPANGGKTGAEREREAWELVKDSTDPGDLRLFIKEYPGGTNTAAAKIRLDDLVWASAKAADKQEPIKAYLEEFPNGANAGAARIRLRQLEATATVTTTPVKTEPGKIVERKSTTGIDLVWVPPGEFVMGSPADEKDREKSEGPERKVTVSDGFWMGKHEVTQSQWKSLMGDVPAGCFSTYDVAGESRPVVCVSWNDAKDFITKLNEQDKEFEYRLPSEAEWEYAARAGTTTRFYWGDDPKNEQMCSYANGADKSVTMFFTWRNTACRDGFAGTSPVGSFPANKFGLFDMSGNVQEWVEDVFVETYEGLGTTQAANIGSGKSRVLRGGSWYGRSKYLRSASRDSNAPTSRDANTGFRLVARSRSGS